jgi:hypothetical protein
VSESPAARPADGVWAALEKGLGAQYRIVRLLGRGGMGAVYLARDETLQRLVAIKVLPPEKGADADSRERFRREARTAARLSHPNVVPLHGFGEVDGLLYLVMGFVRGEPLAARMRREGAVPADDARRIVADVAEALDYAHRQGVVHRDVKPDNIMIEDETGRALLTDFGIAKGLGAGPTVTQVGGIVGTPQYMSPEQASGQGTVDGRTDIYSLGIVAYALLAGRVPFQGAGDQDVLVKHLTQPPRPLAEAAPGIPVDLAQAVDRCLAKDPQARWPDGRSLREAVAPVGLEDDLLPEPLDALDGMGPFLLGPLIAAAFAHWHAYLHPRRPVALLIMLLALAAILIELPILTSAFLLARRRGFTAGQIARAFLRQPRWWLAFWYPAAFRRPGDVWSRLPRPVRWWRASLTLLVADLLALVWLLMLMGNDDALRRVHRGIGVDVDMLMGAITVLSGVLFAGLLWLGLSMVLCARILRSRGLDTYSLQRVSRAVVTGSTSDRRLWKRAEVAALLLPAPGAVRTPSQHPRSPAEYRDGMAALAERLRPAHAGLASQVLTAGRRVLAALADADQEAVRLERDVNPEDEQRLEERLAALDAGRDADADAAEMKRLVAQQLELVRKLRARREEAVARRRALGEDLDRLWAALVRASSATGGDAPHALERLQAACTTAGHGTAEGEQAADASTVTRT